MKNRILPILLGLLVLFAGYAVYHYMQGQQTEPQAIDASTPPASAPAVAPAPPPPAAAVTASTPHTDQKADQKVDLTMDANGLSKATVVIETEKGKIKFKFYPKDAPNTVARMVQLIQTGFYNGLTFHRVVEKFVVQGGDPKGDGTGGSGQKLKAEFNERRHVEGTVAMARAMDPDSADAQFYISLGTHPHLDRKYTVFGQVSEGMDVVKKIVPGDKMIKVSIE